jgi:hypothetical protein
MERMGRFLPPDYRTETCGGLDPFHLERVAAEAQSRVALATWATVCYRARLHIGATAR